MPWSTAQPIASLLLCSLPPWTLQDDPPPTPRSLDLAKQWYRRDMTAEGRPVRPRIEAHSGVTEPCAEDDPRPENEMILPLPAG
ncbi:hypothetical protein [Nocardia sp. NPDC003963]